MANPATQQARNDMRQFLGYLRIAVQVARSREGESQAALASVTGLDPSTISLVECGEASDPQLSTIVSLLSRYGFALVIERKKGTRE